MAVRIRLRRMGAKKQPSYRVVVADSRAPRDGRFVEIIGHYTPLTDPPEVQIDLERARFWLQRGAQPSGPVERFLKKAGLLSATGRAVRGSDTAAETAPVPAAESPEAPAMEPQPDQSQPDGQEQ